MSKEKPVVWDLKIYEPEHSGINSNPEYVDCFAHREAETVRDLNRIQRDTLEAILKRHNIKHQFLGVDAKGERCV